MNEADKDRSLSSVMSSENSVTTAAATAACARLSVWYLKCCTTLVVSATQPSQNELATGGFAWFSRYLSTLKISNIK